MCNVTYSLSLVIGKDVMRLSLTKCAMSLTVYLLVVEKDMRWNFTTSWAMPLTNCQSWEMKYETAFH